MDYWRCDCICRRWWGILLAGIVVGPFTPGFVADAKLAPQLAEIGVILLMFGVGTHFSIRDLFAVRRVALPGAFTQIIVATALGAGVAILWGWSLGAGIIFGLSLSVASTVVLLRALEDRDMIKSNDGRIAIGWLVVEDLLMVLSPRAAAGPDGSIRRSRAQQRAETFGRRLGLRLERSCYSLG